MGARIWYYKIIAVEVVNLNFELDSDLLRIKKYSAIKGNEWNPIPKETMVGTEDTTKGTPMIGPLDQNSRVEYCPMSDESKQKLT